MSVSPDTFIHADIFFFVTTIAVMVLTAALALVAFYALRTLEQARRTLEEIEGHARDISDEVKDFVMDLRESAIYRFLFKRKSKPKSKRNN